MPVVFPGHIRVDGEIDVIQPIQVHCRNTSRYAGQALKEVGLEASARLSGIVHDAGKCCKAFRRYLDKAAHGEAVRRGSVPHSAASVHLILSAYHDPNAASDWKDYVSELLAYAAGAHHGLFDCVDTHSRSYLALKMDSPDYKEAVQNFFSLCINRSALDQLFFQAERELVPKLEQIWDLAQQDERCDGEVAFYTGLLARLLLSAVIEGDRRDTAEFMNGLSYPDLPTARQPLWSRCLARVEHKLSQFPSDTPIQQARQRISQQCRAFADRPSGVYRLNVPTGAGKTLSSLRYALAHSAKWNKARIIFTAPLLSILDQNAKVIRTFIQDDRLVLEHHSNVLRTDGPSDSSDPRALQKELLTENWNAPIIITTLVQLLNTLFSGKSTAVRRFQALCNSVIVIDEVQTVPNKMLTEFNLAVNFLSELCGATVLLCSATQPCLETVCHPLLRAPEEVVPYDRELWKPFQRTTLQNAGELRLEEIPGFALDILEESNSLLVVCNKRDEAEFLYQRLAETEHRCFHLSASMCMAHRKQTLQELEASLQQGGKTGQKTICVSTQVIEAGVDISFERVIRLLAGMESAIQSAGRCNRNGEDPNPAPVYLVRCLGEDLSKLTEIQRAKDASISLLSAFGSTPEQFPNGLSSNSAIQYYYARLYNEMPEGYQDYAVKDSPSLYSLLSTNSGYVSELHSDVEGRFSLCQAFREAGKLFQVFDNDTTDVLVPYGKGVELIAELSSSRAQTDMNYLKAKLDQSKPYTVSLFQYLKRELEDKGALYTICDGSIQVLRPDFYQAQTGLTQTAGAAAYMEVN